MKRLLGFILPLIVFLGLTSKVTAVEPSNDDRNLFSLLVNDIDGKEVDLSQYKGKTLLIVNTASRCGYTPQYKTLEALFEKYQSRGFMVLGFPANNFMGQEPGTNEEIKNFCTLKYHVTFPMFGKISVAGKDIHPLYQYLTSRPEFAGPISWNFNKFLIDPQGRMVARFASGVDPMSDKMIEELEKILPNK